MINSKIPIIDTHFHLWDLDTNYYPWLTDGDRPSLIKDYSSLRKNYLLSDYFTDVGDLNVVAAVHVQAEYDHTDPVGETRWLQAVADDPASRGFPQAIVADANFADPDVEKVIEGHARFPNMRGIRHVLHRQLNAAVPYDPLHSDLWQRKFPLLARYGWSFDMQLFPEQCEAAVDLIRNNPEIQIVLTHAGMPPLGDRERMTLWRSSIREYAKSPNVAVKISGFGTFDADWGAPRIKDVVFDVVEAFGIQRCILASNYPVERLTKRYDAVWHAYFDIFSSLSEAEKEMIFWRNARDIYRITGVATDESPPD